MWRVFARSRPRFQNWERTTFTVEYVQERRRRYSGQCASFRNLTSSRQRSHINGSTRTYLNRADTFGNIGDGSQSTPSTGLFDKPIFSSAEGFNEATQLALLEARKLVSEISSMVGEPCIEIVNKMDELSDVLCQVADLAECIRLLHSDPTIIEAAQNANLVINNYVEELNTDTSLHLSLANFLQSEQFTTADRTTQRTTQLLMHDFESSGIHLDAEKRDSVVKLNQQILELNHYFVHSTSLPTLLPLNKCPKSLQEYFPLHGEYVSIDHVLHSSRNSELRELSYKAYFADVPAQREVLETMLKLRHELSVLVGYPSFAHRTLKMCMVESPEKAEKFLKKLSEMMSPLAEEEAKEMQSFCPSPSNHQVLQPWDVTFSTDEAKKFYFPTKGSDLREYFSLENTLAGLGNLFNQLFGVRIDIVPAKHGEIWDNTVIKLAFVHETEGLLGYTYCDLFARASKTISDCHFTIQGGRELADGAYQTPIIVVCCNIPQKGTTIPSTLLSQRSVENLFHELGHALHSMLGRSKYQNVTGTRCSTDFAEVPSTLMEYFLNDSRVLQSFAKHFKTGLPIPDSHLATFQLSGKLFSAFDMQLQTVYALTDLLLHSRPPLQSSCTEFAADLYHHYAPMRPIPGVTWLLRFSHLYGYGSRYYSYLWSRAVSCLIWRECFKNDPFLRESGDRLRGMLRHGGGMAPMELVKEVLGFEPTIEDLVSALYTDVKEHREQLKQFVNRT